MSKNTHNNTVSLGTDPLRRLLPKYAIPAIIAMASSSLYNIIDSIFVGHGVGGAAISGMAVTLPIMNIASAFGAMVGVGAASRISIRLGEGNRRAAEQILGNAVLLNLLLGLSVMGIMLGFLDPILHFFSGDKASEETIAYARDFMRIIMAGNVITHLYLSLNEQLRASGYPVKSMAVMLTAVGMCVVLNPLFIFVFDWGIKGAAIATDIAMTCSMIFVMAHFMRRDSTLRFTRGIYRLRWRIIAGIISIGAAPSLVNLAGSAINVIVNTSLYTHGSDNAVAASGIFTTYTSLLVMVVVGLCQGMQPILGYNYGAGLYGRLKRCYWLATGAATAIVTAGCAFGLLWPGLIARAFTTDPTLIAVTSRALSLSLLAFWAVGFQIVATTFFQSIGKAGKSIFLSLTRQVIFLIPLLLTLPDRLGLDGVWLSFPSSDVMATIVTALMITFQLRRLPAAPLPCFAGTKATK